MTLLRERWPLLAGLLAAAGVLLLFRVAVPEESDPWASRSALGVVAVGWALAMIVIATGLGAQLLLSTRVSMQRERRLVRTAAALREATAKLELLAATDGLTGLPNRRAFADRLGVEFRRSRRYTRPLSLLMIDIDRFKEMNDTHGHPFGDHLLAETAATIARELRETDLAGRYGGEEFIVMLPETTPREARIVADRLRAAIAERRFSHDGAEARLSISVGVAGFEAATYDQPEDVVTDADRALYAAKRAGRDRVVSIGDLDRGATAAL